MLDQPVGLGLLRHAHRTDPTGAIEGELRFAALQLQAAAAHPLGAERGRRFASGRERTRPRLRRILAAGEDAVDTLVVQTLVGADQRPREARANDTGAGQLELDADRLAVLPRHERAFLVRQRRRQHRLDGSRHVHAGRPPPRFAVEQRPRRDECRHVGDVHVHADRALGRALGRDRVVEVTRRGRIDREGRQPAQVSSLGGPASRLTCLALDGGIEAAREPAIDHQRLDHVARDVGAPEPAHDLGSAAAARGADRDEHEVAGCGARAGEADAQLPGGAARPRAREKRQCDDEPAAAFEHGGEGGSAGAQ